MLSHCKLPPFSPAQRKSGRLAYLYDRLPSPDSWEKLKLCQTLKDTFWDKANQVSINALLHSSMLMRTRKKKKALLIMCTRLCLTITLMEQTLLWILGWSWVWGSNWRRYPGQIYALSNTQSHWSYSDWVINILAFWGYHQKRWMWVQGRPWSAHSSFLS